MSAGWEPRLDILPAPQRRLWDEFAELPAGFTLYGGTALALRLGHRQSVDFDFFRSKSVDPLTFTESVPFLAGATVVQREPNTLTVSVDRDGPVMVSFFGVPALKRVAPPDVVASNHLRVASLLDLAGTKASVVQLRSEAKDYLDIDALISAGVGLDQALGAAQAIYGPAFNPQITLKALCWFDDGNLAQLPQALKERLARAAREIDLDRLPLLTAISGI